MLCIRSFLRSIGEILIWLQKKTDAVIKGAWVSLGCPFDLPMIKEKDDGIIDVEALIMSTLMVMKQDRMTTDLPAWLSRFSSLINLLAACCCLVPPNAG